jgi:predicted enzyme related to lactoylglutathione lyase
VGEKHHSGSGPDQMSVSVTEGVRWILACTTNFDETLAFFRDVMGLAITEEGVPITDTEFCRYALIRMPNDVVLEVVEPRDSVRDLYKGAIVSFTVNGVAQARREMENRQVEFLTPIFDTKQEWGWAYFRGSDGNVFQIQGPYRM